jgi:hypothetical protein
MAKKTTKKKPTRSSKPKSAPKSAGAPAYPGSPKRITTGSGASAEEIGKQLVADFNKGHYHINDRLWSSKLVCIEGGGLAWHGMKNVEAKNDFWNAGNLIHGASAEGPYVGSTGFAVKFRMDVEDKSSGRRTIMEEVGVYTVRNGKIVQEEFMYGSMLPAESALPHVLQPL